MEAIIFIIYILPFIICILTAFVGIGRGLCNKRDVAYILAVSITPIFNILFVWFLAAVGNEIIRGRFKENVDAN